MAGAWFSIFRVAGRHEAVGLWLEDMLAGDRRLWLVDEALEASAPEGAVLGMRLSAAGPFHAGFGIIVRPDDETLDFCLGAKARGADARAATDEGRLPRRGATRGGPFPCRLRQHGEPSRGDVGLQPGGKGAGRPLAVRPLPPPGPQGGQPPGRATPRPRRPRVA